MQSTKAEQEISAGIAQQEQASRARKKKDNQKMASEVFLLEVFLHPIVSQFEVDISHVSAAFTTFVAADTSFLEPTGS